MIEFLLLSSKNSNQKMEFRLRLSDDEDDDDEEPKTNPSVDLGTRKSVDATYLDADQDDANEEDEDDDDDEIEGAKKSKRGQNKEYEEVKRFNDYPSALLAIEEGIDNQKWTRRYSRDTQVGEKIFFPCINHPNCPKTLFLLKHDDSLDVSIWLCSDQDHQHSKQIDKGRLLKSACY